MSRLRLNTVDKGKIFSHEDSQLNQSPVLNSLNRNQLSLAELLNSAKTRSTSPKFNSKKYKSTQNSKLLKISPAQIHIDNKFIHTTHQRLSKSPSDNLLKKLHIPSVQVIQKDIPNQLLKIDVLRLSQDKVRAAECITSSKSTSRRMLSPVNHLQKCKIHDRWLNVIPFREHYSFRPSISPKSRHLISTSSIQTRLYDDASRRLRERSSSPKYSKTDFYARYRDSRILELRKDLEIVWESYTTDSKIGYDIYYKILNKMFFIDNAYISSIPSSWQWLSDRVSAVSFDVLLAFFKSLLNLGGEFGRYKAELKLNFGKLVSKKNSNSPETFSHSANQSPRYFTIPRTSIQFRMKIGNAINLSSAKKLMQPFMTERMSDKECVFSSKRW